MTRHVTLCLLLSGLILLNASSAMAQRWGRPRTPSAGACFYRDINFGGEYFCAQIGSEFPRVPSGTNDEISSIRVFGNAEVIVYRDGSFRGDSKRFDYNVNDLRRSGFNDRITSVRILGRGGYGRDRDRDRPRRLSRQEAEATVRRAYLAVLQREPDPASSGYVNEVMNNGWTQQRVEDELRRSREYREKHRRR